MLVVVTVWKMSAWVLALVLTLLVPFRTVKDVPPEQPTTLLFGGAVTLAQRPRSPIKMVPGPMVNSD